MTTTNVAQINRAIKAGKSVLGWSAKDGQPFSLSQARVRKGALQGMALGKKTRPYWYATTKAEIQGDS